MQNRKVLTLFGLGIMLFIYVTFATTAGEQQSIESRQSAAVGVYQNALLIDLSQTLLSWEAGGYGLSLGYERALFLKTALFTEGIYMYLHDDPSSPRLLIAAIGLRYYFAVPVIEGFYTGLSFMAGHAAYSDGNEGPSFLSGLQAELGYAWRAGAQRRFILEPYIKYPYIFGEDPLIGVAPGLSVGLLF